MRPSEIFNKTKKPRLSRGFFVLQVSSRIELDTPGVLGVFVQNARRRQIIPPVGNSWSSFLSQIPIANKLTLHEYKLRGGYSVAYVSRPVFYVDFVDFKTQSVAGLQILWQLWYA